MQPYASDMTVRRSNLYWRSPSCCAPVGAHSIRRSDEPLSVKQLEAGLQILDRIDSDKEEFWNENGRAFRATIRLAIRETAEALLLQQMPEPLRDELEGQLAWLRSCLKRKARH